MFDNSHEKPLLRRPALVIGLGGTGVKTLRIIKKMSEQPGGEELARMIHNKEFVLYGIDTDPDTFKSSVKIATKVMYDRSELPAGMHDAAVLLPKIDEHCHIKTSDIINAMETVEGELRHRRDNPKFAQDGKALEHAAIADWYPFNTDPKSPTVGLGFDSRKGAGQYRFVGRVGLFLEARDIYADLRRLVSRVHSAALERGVQAEVYVVCSLAGGTGGGMFWDIGFMLSSIARDLMVSGCFLLPDAFARVDSAGRIEANAYAALKELSHYKNWRMSTPYVATYPLGQSQKRFKAEAGDPSAFDLVYLFDGAKKSGDFNEDDLIDLSCRKIATSIMASVREDVYDKISVGANNETGDGGYPTTNKRSGYVFSTMAATEFRFENRSALAGELRTSALTWIAENRSPLDWDEESAFKTRPLWLKPLAPDESLIGLCIKAFTESFSGRPGFVNKASDEIDQAIQALQDLAKESESADDTAWESSKNLCDRIKEILSESSLQQICAHLQTPPKSSGLLGLLKRQDTPSGYLTVAEVFAAEIDEAKAALSDATEFLETLPITGNIVNELNIGGLLSVPDKRKLAPKAGEAPDKKIIVLDREATTHSARAMYSLFENAPEGTPPEHLLDACAKVVEHLKEIKRTFNGKKYINLRDQGTLGVALLEALYEDHKIEAQEALKRRHDLEHRRRQYERIVEANPAVPTADAEVTPRPQTISEDRLHILFEPFLRMIASIDTGEARIQEYAKKLASVCQSADNPKGYDLSDAFSIANWERALRRAVSVFQETNVLGIEVVHPILTHAVAKVEGDGRTNAEIEKAEVMVSIATFAFTTVWFGRDEAMMEQIGGEVELRRRLNLGASAVFDPGAVEHGPVKEKIVLIPPEDLVRGDRASGERVSKLFESYAKSIIPGSPSVRVGNGSERPVIFYQALFHAPQEIRGLDAMQESYLNETRERRVFFHFDKHAADAPDLDVKHPAQKPVRCGNPDCDGDLSDVDRTEITCPFCRNPIRNRCGNSECKADNIQYQIARDGFSIGKAPKHCPSCNREMRTAWWRCERSLHRHIHISTESTVCLLCVAEASEGKISKDQVSRRADDAGKICDGCTRESDEQNPYACTSWGDGNTVQLDKELACFYDNGVSPEEASHFKRLLSRSDSRFPKREKHNGHLCPSSGPTHHMLFPTCPVCQDDEKHRHHLVRSGPNGYFKCPTHTEMEFLECGCCGYPIDRNHPDLKIDKETRCPRCLEIVRPCAYCTDQTNLLQKPVVGDHGEASCPHCTNLMDIDKKRGADSLIELRRQAAFCRNIFACTAGQNVWSTAAELGRSQCQACPPKLPEGGTPLFPVRRLASEVRLCAVCLYLLGDGESEPVAVDPISQIVHQIEEAWDERKKSGNEIQAHANCGICGCDLTRAKALARRAALLELPVEIASRDALTGDDTIRDRSKFGTKNDGEIIQEEEGEEADEEEPMLAHVARSRAIQGSPRPAEAQLALRILKAMHLNHELSEEAVYHELTSDSGDTLSLQGFETAKQEILLLFEGTLFNKGLLERRLAVLEKVRTRMES